MIDDSRLRSRLRAGGRVTLVLGAGVSHPRGVPLWSDLLRETWKLVTDKDPYEVDSELLKRARQACEEQRLPKSFVERLDIRRHPLETQFAFEQIYAALRWQDIPAFRKKLGLRGAGRPLKERSGSNEGDVAELFVEILRKVLYSNLTHPGGDGRSTDTLSLVAGAVRCSAMSTERERRITQVITFNVDDLLEREVNGSRQRRYLAQPICRASDFRPTARRTIPVYHLHGFVPVKANSYTIDKLNGSIADADPAAESLVFTDEQYWRLVGNPTGFASRIFCNALSDCCVFIGLSMTDINIIRWLAQDAIERSDDLRRLRTEWSVSELEFDLGEELSRHYWITPGRVRKRHRDRESARVEEASMRFEAVENLLARRGVACVTIPSWDSDEFHRWWKNCFYA